MADSTRSLEDRIQEFLGQSSYRPLKQHELARALNLSGKQRVRLRETLRSMERVGRIERLRKNRWALPDSGQKVLGILRCHAQGFGFVTPEGDEHTEDIYVAPDAMSVAMDGDKVQLSVQRLPARSGKKRGHGPSKPKVDGRLEGKVLRVIERSRDTLVGIVRRTPYYAYVQPDNPRIQHEVRLRKSEHPFPENHMVVVKLDPWSSLAQPLVGVIIEDLGKVDGPGVAMLALLRDHQLDEAFPEAVSIEAKALSPTLSKVDLKGRTNLRDVFTFTIDPVDAKDFDDAVSLELLPNGNLKLGVHIADVAHFVTPGTALDDEARHRGTSIYMVDRVVTMLPRTLTTDICSLLPGEDRLTHTVELTLTGSGEVVAVESYRSVIHSKARLNYDEVQAVLAGKPPKSVPQEVLPHLAAMHKLSKAMRKKRIRDGSIDLALPEVTCELDDEGAVKAIRLRKSNEAYQLIEEFMLAANQAVAHKLFNAEVPSLYRVHEAPDDEQWEVMADQLNALGVHHSPSSRHELNTLAASLRKGPLDYAAQLVMLRNFKRAEYRGEQHEHFGLAFTYYTHFTSPIRRYPDLIVHRLLSALEEGSPPPLGKEDLNAMGAHCSQQERKAAEAEEESVRIKRIEYYEGLLWSGNIGPFNALIVNMTPKGLIVELRDTLQRGMVPFKLFTDDFYQVRDDRTQAVGRRHKKKWRMGDKVRVELIRVDSDRRLIDFRVV